MKQQKFQPNEIDELLTSLIDFTMMESCSLSSLKNNPADIIKRMKMGLTPLVLIHNGKRIALLCDPSVYQQTEDKRRRLEALLVDVSSESTPGEFVPTVGRRQMPPSECKKNLELKRCNAEIEKLKRQINSQKFDLSNKEEELQKAADKKQKLMSAMGTFLLPAK